MSAPKTIVYFRNGIGNFIMMTPALRALASMDPCGKIDMCIPSDWTDSRAIAVRDILQRWDIINQVVAFPAEQFPHNYEQWFHVSHTEGGKAHSHFMSKGKPLWHLQRWGETHEIDYYMDHVRQLGYNGFCPDQFIPTAEGPILSSPAKMIGLGNGAFASKMWDKKRWPHFNQLALTLKRYFGCTIVLLGAGKELQEVDKAYVDHNYVGQLTITETAKAISQLDLYITTDSGNMHIADALGIPVIALFGATYLSKNRPVSKQAVIVRAGYPCQPCQGKESFNSCQDYRCMNDLTVGDIIHLVKKRLSYA